MCVSLSYGMTFGVPMFAERSGVCLMLSTSVCVFFVFFPGEALGSRRHFLVEIFVC